MDEGQNYTAFSSRGLLDMIGDLNNKALEASRMKDFIGVLGGRFLNWAQRKSLFPLHLGIKCCALEMAAAGAPRFDAESFGVVFRSSPRQCDVLLVNGPISKKFADPIVRLWEQMPEPKWCIAMHASVKTHRTCTNPSTLHLGTLRQLELTPCFVVPFWLLLRLFLRGGLGSPRPARITAPQAPSEPQ